MKRLFTTAAAALFAAIGLVVVAPAAPAAADATRDRIAQIAEAEYRNDSRNHEVNGNGLSDCNFYSGAMGRPNSNCPNPNWGSVDWCADFVRWVWRETGGIAHLGDLNSYAHSLRTYGLNHDTWNSAGGGYVPQPGDAFTLRDGNGNGLADHTGLVVAYNGGGSFTTIEGNMGEGDARDRITRRTRNVNDGDLWGFSSPVYQPANEPVPVVERVGASGVSFAGRFHEYFRRADNTLIHHVYTSGGAGWDADKNVGGAIASPPVAVIHDGSMFVFARGTDNAAKYRFHDGDAWDASWRSIPGGFTGTPALAVKQQRMFVFVHSGDRVAYRFHDAGKGWTDGGDWRDLGRPGGVTVESDPVTAFFNGRMYVFVRGSDSRIWTRYLKPDDTWGEWGALAGTVAGQPAAAVNGDTFYVFARTANNAVLYHYHNVNDAQWSTNKTLHGDVRGDVTAVSAGGTVLVLARNAVGDVVYRAHDGAAWNDASSDPTRWRNLGHHGSAAVDSSPVSFRHSGSAVVAARGTDKRLYSRTWNPSTGWHEWGALPGSHELAP